MNFISVSGGNDSIALLQYLYLSKITQAHAFYLDTGWSEQSWILRIEQVKKWAESDLGFKFTIITGKFNFETLVIHKELFPFPRGKRFCTTFLKIIPCLDFLHQHDPKEQGYLFLGKRKAESIARRNIKYIEHNDIYGSRYVINPLCDYSNNDRNQLINQTPFAILDHRSRDCRACIDARKNELATLSLDFIERIELLETFVSIKRGKPCYMFNPNSHGNSKGIREVVQWANLKNAKMPIYKPSDYCTNSGLCSI